MQGQDLSCALVGGGGGGGPKLACHCYLTLGPVVGVRMVIYMWVPLVRAVWQPVVEYQGVVLWLLQSRSDCGMAIDCGGGGGIWSGNGGRWGPLRGTSVGCGCR